ncbi:hypothetical protein LXL04_026289 [Taraxacum kok-saghyz]
MVVLLLGMTNTQRVSTKYPTVVFQAAASQDMWFWHSYFGVLGSHNDLNILNSSDFYTKLHNYTAPDSSFILRGTQYRFGYYLVDGIYPERSIFFKTLAYPDDPQRQKTNKKISLAWLAYVGCSHQIWSACANMLNANVSSLSYLACVECSPSLRLNGVGGERPAATPRWKFTAGESDGVEKASGKLHRPGYAVGKIEFSNVQALIVKLLKHIAFFIFQRKKIKAIKSYIKIIVSVHSCSTIHFQQWRPREVHVRK